MLDVVSLDGSETSLFSATRLSRKISLLARIGRAAQLNALVIERQQRISVFEDDDVLASQANSLHGVVKQNATEVLDTRVPQLLQVLLQSPREAANLINIALRDLSHLRPAEAVTFLRAVETKLTGYRYNADGLSLDLK